MIWSIIMITALMLGTSSALQQQPQGRRMASFDGCELEFTTPVSRRALLSSGLGTCACSTCAPGALGVTELQEKTFAKAMASPAALEYENFGEASRLLAPFVARAPIAILIQSL